MTAHASPPVRLAIVGGHRGETFSRLARLLSDRMHLVAICDRDDAVLARWRADNPEARVYTRYDELLADAAIDAVVLATPFPGHARQAVAALEAGKHVLSEVIGATTLDECWALIETAEAADRTYMFAENCCYLRHNLMVERMVRHGVFGQVTYLEGAYIHDCRPLLHTTTGELAWRGQLRTQLGGVSYPTHALGPLDRWLRAGDPHDRFETLWAFTTGSAAIREHFGTEFGADHPGAQPDHWRHGDSGTVVLRSTNGVLAVLRIDSSSPRPSTPTTHFSLQGTNGAYLSPRTNTEEPLVWINGRSTGRSGHRSGQVPAQWEPMQAYAAEFEDPRWNRHSEDALGTSHGGADYFVLAEFLGAIRKNRPPDLDVYDAAAWSSVLPLSRISLADDGRPVAIPDFRRGVATTARERP